MNFEPVKFLREHTMFGGYYPLMNPDQQIRYVNTILDNVWAYEQLCSIPQTEIGHLKICPECYKAEMKKHGFYWIHRAHHMPGVSACHIHGCKLVNIIVSKKNTKDHDLHVRKGRELELTNMVEPETASRSEVSFAEYAYRFMTAKIKSNSDVLRNSAHKKMMEIADGLLDMSSIDDYVKKIGHYDQNYITVRDRLSHRSFKRSGRIKKETLLKAIYSLFQTPLELNDYDFLGNDFSQEVGEEYTVIDDRDPVIKRIKHNTCGYVFYTVHSAFTSGWKCPKCDAKLGNQELFKRLFESAGNGEYELLSSYHGQISDITVRHILCGKTYSTTPAEFIGLGTRCDCNKVITIKDAQNFINKQGVTRYEIIGVQNKGNAKYMRWYENKILIKDKKRGDRLYLSWQTIKMHINDPEYEFQRSDKITEFKNNLSKRIEKLTGDEYTVISVNGKSVNDNMVIRHNVCGNTYSVNTKYFLEGGSRCRKCLERHNYPYEDMKRITELCSGGRYKVEKTGKRSKIYMIITDTTDGSIIRLKPRHLIQELLRPTPSDKLPYIDHSKVNKDDLLREDNK